MNFTEKIERYEIRVELKYCERCGGLWLRSETTFGVYCTTCSAHLAAMRNAREPRPSKTKSRQTRLQGPKVEQEYRGEGWNVDSVEYIEGVAVEVSA
jgi:Zn-finger nucleic acid-binding protein